MMKHLVSSDTRSTTASSERTTEAARETATRSSSGNLLYCGELFEKDLYKNHMAQVRGEELQLAPPRLPSATATAITPTSPATTKKQRGTTARP